MAKRATFTVQTVELVCPYCGFDIPEPQTDSLFWTMEDLDRHMNLTAQLRDEPPSFVMMHLECGRLVKIQIPKSVRMA